MEKIKRKCTYNYTGKCKILKLEDFPMLSKYNRYKKYCIVKEIKNRSVGEGVVADSDNLIMFCPDKRSYT